MIASAGDQPRKSEDKFLSACRDRQLAGKERGENGEGEGGEGKDRGKGKKKEKKRGREARTARRPLSLAFPRAGGTFLPAFAGIRVADNGRRGLSLPPPPPPTPRASHSLVQPIVGDLRE